MLSLLLLISDRPLEHSRLADLAALVPAEAPRGVLTWADIIAADPLSGEEWRDDVDFGAESSDEWSDGGVSAQRMREEIIGERKLEEEGRKRRRCGGGEDEDDGYEDGNDDCDNDDNDGKGPDAVEGFMVSGDQEGLGELKKAQYWDQVIRPVDGEVDVSVGFGGGISPQIYTELTHSLMRAQGRTSRSFPSSRPSARSCSCCSATRASSSARRPPATR